MSGRRMPEHEKDVRSWTPRVQREDGELLALGKRSERRGQIQSVIARGVR